VLLADQELLQQARGVRARRNGREPARQRGGVVEPVGRLGAGAGRRLGHQRETHLVRERHRLLGRGDELVPGARDARGPQYRLHPGLVPHVERGLHVHPVDTQCLAHLGQRHLQLLQSADQAFHRPHLPAQAGHRGGDLARVERVVDPPVPVQVFLEHRRQPVRRLGGDHREPDAGQRGGGGHEPGGGLQQEGCDESSDDHNRTLPVRGVPR
jgi:hypothetical protein